jgi:hypothetical protein
VYALLGCYAASLGNWFLTLYSNIVGSKCPKRLSGEVAYPKKWNLQLY